MTRKDALLVCKVAGYHQDRATFTRVYIENRISRPAADEAWRSGMAAKRAGIPCVCAECKAKS